MNVPQLSEEQIDKIVGLALAEDISHGDVTSEAIIPPDLHGKASIQVKATGVLAGGDVARRVFLQLDPQLPATAQWYCHTNCPIYR